MRVLRLLTLVCFILALAACQTMPAAETPNPAPTSGAQPGAGQAPGERANVPPSAAGAPARVEQATPTPPPPTATPTRTPTPTITRTPTPSPTPIPQARRLTEGGCCSAPSWSADSAQVIFIDKPSPDAPTAYYAVDTTKPGSKPALFLDRIASWVGNYEFLVTRRDGFTTVERRSDGQVFRINTGRCSVTQPTGCQVSISPDRQRVSWSQTIEATGPFERRTTRVWIANLDGSNARVVATLLSTRAGASWFPDSKRLLLSGRPSLDTQELVLTVLNLETGAQQEITRAERINRATLSPQSGWLAYAIAFHDDDAQNGLWVVRTDGTGLRKLPFFGPFSWRSEGKLLYLPLEEESQGHPVIEYDVDKDTQRVLIDPKLTPFKIAFGDYAISPDGRKIAYVDSIDRNIYMLELPE